MIVSMIVHSVNHYKLNLNLISVPYDIAAIGQSLIELGGIDSMDIGYWIFSLGWVGEGYVDSKNSGRGVVASLSARVRVSRSLSRTWRQSREPVPPRRWVILPLLLESYIHQCVRVSLIYRRWRRTLVVWARSISCDPTVVYAATHSHTRTRTRSQTPCCISVCL